MMARILGQLAVISLACFFTGELAAKPPPTAFHAQCVVLGQAPGTGTTIALARLILEVGYECPKISGPQRKRSKCCLAGTRNTFR